MMHRWLWAVLALLGAASTAKAECAGQPGACELADGEYHILLPEIPATNRPVVLFLHGAGGNGSTTISNRRLTEPLRARGYAVIAPTGSRSFQGRDNTNWVFYPGWDGRDEVGFLVRVLEDAAERFNLDAERAVLAGFSAGGFMVNYLACARPDAFSAYAPVAGGFWRPNPVNCAGPVRMLHTHGWADRTVPLEGRILGGGRFEQGDIFAGLEIWRQTNRCAGHDPTETSSDGVFWHRIWGDCTPGSALEFALFAGGHTVPTAWADMMLNWYEAGPATH
ncbi:MAG: PHB depolymerase family esterase [Arenibacterium sp.]